MQGQQGSTPHTTITIPIRTVCEVPPLYMTKANIHFKRSMGNGVSRVVSPIKLFSTILSALYVPTSTHILFYEANTNKSLFWFSFISYCTLIVFLFYAIIFNSVNKCLFKILFWSSNFIKILFFIFKLKEVTFNFFSSLNY